MSTLWYWEHSCFDKIRRHPYFYNNYFAIYKSIFQQTYAFRNATAVENIMFCRTAICGELKTWINLPKLVTSGCLLSTSDFRRSEKSEKRLLSTCFTDFDLTAMFVRTLPTECIAYSPCNDAWILMNCKVAKTRMCVVFRRNQIIRFVTNIFFGSRSGCRQVMRLYEKDLFLLEVDRWCRVRKI